MPHLDALGEPDRRPRDVLLAAFLGGVVTVTLLAVPATPLDLRLTQFFEQASWTSAYGRNIVNVILVDCHAIRMEYPGYHTLFQVLIAGVTGAFLTGDIFNLHVCFEVMPIASFGLLVLGGRPAQIDGAIKYVTLNLISTVLFLSAVGLL